MTRRFLTPIIFLTLAVPSVFAQRTAPTAAQLVSNKVGRLTTLLSLNATQVTDATQIFTTEQAALSGISASLKAARTALHTAIQNNDLSSTVGITAEAAAIGSLTTQEITAQATASAAFYALLNPTQQAQYLKLGGLSAYGGGRGGFARDLRH